MKVIFCFLAIALACVFADDAAITYSILPGVNEQVRTKGFTIPVGGTFYDVMVLQSWLDPKGWGIKSTEHPEYGRFITSIGGLANNEEDRLAWQYYILPEIPLTNEIPDDKYRATVAVDRTLIEDNQHFLFIYMGY